MSHGHFVLRNVAKTLLAAGVLALAAFLLYRTFRSYHLTEIHASLAAASPAGIAAAAGFALASYLCLTGFDTLGVRYAGGRLPYRRIALTSLTSLSIGHSVGFAALSSGAVRYRFYSRFGLGLEQIAKIILLCAATVGLGLASLMSLGFLARPDVAGRIGGFAPPIVLVLGLVTAMAPVAYLALAAFAKGELDLGSWAIRMPPMPIALGQIVLGPLNLACVTACLYMALPGERTIGYLDVVAAYTVANALSLVTHVPGGIGVIEAVVTLLLPGADVIGALIIFRVVYFLVPFIAGSVSFAVAELTARRADHGEWEGSGFLRLWR